MGVSGQDERSPFSQRGFVVSAGVLGVLVLFALVIALGAGGGRARSAAPGAVPAGPSSPSARQLVGASSAGDPEGCSLPAGSQAVPSTPPASSWVLVGSMAAPSAPTTVGPQRTLDGFRVCYADSPLGALYATVNFWASGTAFPQSEVYARLAADTPARAEIVAQSRGDDSRLDSQGRVQVAAFQFTSYTPATADVSLVLQTDSGALIAVASTMVFQQGDWRYVIPPDGEPAAGQIQSLDGYVPWSGA